MSKNELSEDREEWLERMKKEGKLADSKKEDHRRMSRGLENATRRKILEYIGEKGKKTLEEIKNKFDFTKSQAKMHLDFLEHGLIIECEEKKDKTLYKITPRGKGQLENRG